MNMQPPILIQDVDSLSKALEEIKDATHLFLDTEFLRERTYYPILSTIQFYAETENVFIIDVLAEGIEISQFLEFIKNPNLLKIFHSGRQDIEIFFHDFNLMPLPLFDTQVAACYLGYGEQVSFESIVKNKTDIVLDKSLQRTNWLKRPLSEEQLTYAGLDVYALSFIYHSLQKELERKNRSQWCIEDINNLTNPETYRMQPETLLKRTKNRLSDGVGIDILFHLLVLREELAIELNIIRNMVCYDDTLVEIAEKKPRTFDGIRKIIRKSHEAFIEKIADILEIIERAVLNKESLQEKYLKGKSVQNLNNYQEKLSNLLMIYIKQIADENHISPRLIASQSDINNYILGNDDSFLTGWRYELCGETLAEISEGKKALFFDGKHIRLRDNL